MNTVTPYERFTRPAAGTTTVHEWLKPGERLSVLYGRTITPIEAAVRPFEGFTNLPPNLPPFILECETLPAIGQEVAVYRTDQRGQLLSIDFDARQAKVQVASEFRPGWIARNYYFYELRRIVPADFLHRFVAYLHEAHSGMRDDLDAGRYFIRRHSQAAAEAWNRGSHADDGAIEPILEQFLSVAIEVAELERELYREGLDDLEQQAGNAADLLGSIDLDDPAFPAWWNRFLLDAHNREHWDAAGFTLDDLRAIATPEQREALGVVNPNL